MTKINKLNQTFVPQTEATALSLNLLSAKIDEVIDGITTANGTIAFPVTKGGTEYKITTLGTGLNVSENTLSASTSYTLPTATSTTLGGVKVGSGLSISSGSLSVNHDSTLSTTGGVLGVANPGSNISSVNLPLTLNSGALGVAVDDSTIKVNGLGLLYSTVSGGVTTAAMNTAIENAINGLDASTVGGNTQYISLISETNGVISATAKTLPTTKVSVTNGVYNLDYSTTNLMSINSNTQLLTINSNGSSANFFLLRVAADVYYQFNNGAKVKMSGTSILVNENRVATLSIYVPVIKNLTVQDSGGNDVTFSFVENGLSVILGALYTKYTFAPEGTYVQLNYNITLT